MQQGLVLGVEAVEGTDALLARCAGLRRATALSSIALCTALSRS